MARLKASRTIRQAGELRRSDVESLRALAAVAVFTCHVFTTAHLSDPSWSSSALLHRMLLRAGYGVYLFFALTGYLLFRPFLRAMSGDRVDLRKYAVNRIVRILPLYYVAVIALLALNPASDAITAGSWLRFLTLTQNYSPLTVGRVDGAMWSIAVELQFYLLLPFVAMLLAAVARGSVARLLTVFGAAAVAGAALKLWLAGKGPGGVGWTWSIVGSGYFFVPGLVLAILAEHWPRRISPLARSPTVWLTVSAVLWILSLTDGRYSMLLAAPASFFLIGVCVLPLRPSAAVSVLRWRPLAGLGVVSYSFYIWHKPLIEEVHRRTGASASGLFLVATPLAVLAAGVSYAVVESPFLHARQKWVGARAAGGNRQAPDHRERKLWPSGL